MKERKKERMPKPREVGWLACDHTRSGRLQVQACLQILLEENPHENRNPTFRAEGKGSFSWDSVKWFNKPDLAGTSKKKTSLFLPVMRVPGCAKTLSKRIRNCRLSLSWDLAWLPLLGRESSWAAGKLSHSWVGTPLSPQTKRSHFSRGQPRSTRLALGLTQAPRVWVVVAASPHQGKLSGMDQGSWLSWVTPPRLALELGSILMATGLSAKRKWDRCKPSGPQEWGQNWQLPWDEYLWDASSFIPGQGTAEAQGQKVGSGSALGAPPPAPRLPRTGLLQLEQLLVEVLRAQSIWILHTFPLKHIDSTFQLKLWRYLNSPTLRL